jgi:hypothetical protein
LTGGLNQELWYLFGSMPDKLFSNYIPPMKNHIAQFCDDYLDILMRHEIHPLSKIDERILQNLKVSINPRISMKDTSQRKEYPKIIHNYYKSFVSFIKEKKIRNLRHIHIFSPIHFNGIPSAEEIVDDIDKNNAKLIQRIDYPLFKEFLALFPDKKKASISFYSSDEVNKEFLNKDLPITFFKNPQRSHLKAIIFDTPQKTYMLSGSANFSINAFRKRVLNGGNSELMLYSDISGKGPKMREIIVGKSSEIQKGINYPPIMQSTRMPISIVNQMDVFKVRRKKRICYEVHIYKNPKIKSSQQVSIRYSPLNEDSKEKRRNLPKVSLKNQMTKITCSAPWMTLIEERPLICFYGKQGFEFSFPVNYNFDDSDEEPQTDFDREYADLFSFFGYKWKKGNSTTTKTSRNDNNDEDDAEPKNRYQSINDKFYHDWKHIYWVLKTYKKKKEMRLQYRASKLKIEDFLRNYEKDIRSSTDDGYLTPVQIKFIKENILTI